MKLDCYIELRLYLIFKKMKDIIKRVVIGVISGALLGYLTFLFVSNITIVQTWYIQFQTLYFLILVVVCLILFIFFAVYPVHFRMTKGTLFVLGLALIIIGQTVLLNDIVNKVYIGDIFSLLGVVLTLLAWTNVLITDKVKKVKAGKKVEIIEV